MEAQTIQAKLPQIVQTKVPTFDPAEQQAVGIEEYIAKGKQIPAITKYLLSDFIVNQIDVNQNVVVLDNKPMSVKMQSKQKKANYEMTKQLFELIQANLSLKVAQQVQSLYQKLQTGQRVDWDYIIEDVPKQKTQRLKMHTFVREKLQNIQSTTLDGNKIKLRFNKKLRKMDPLARHKYTHFKLFKSNIDTMSALFKLSKITGISQKVFSSAGLKDKRGITTQLISVFNSDINSLKKFYAQADRNRQIWIDGLQEHKDDAIAVGCLYGNQFGLILRLLKPEDASQLNQRVQMIKKHGIINYFGMQRFGSCATRTHLIGVRIIKKQWKQLVEDLLLQDTGNSNLNNLKRQMYENKEYNKAERVLSNKYKVQKSLFQGLSRHGTNYLNVFQNLPRAMKTLYCHALQSYLWNRITSRRIRQLGTKLIVGDLVASNQSKIKKDNQPQQQQIPQEDKHQNQEMHAQGAIQQQDVVQDEQIQITQVTEQNIQNYTVFDLVAPLYGVSINLPENSIMGKFVEDQLYKMGLHKSQFHEKSKSLCFKGGYRKCIVRPPKIQCEIISHKQKKAELLSPFYMKDEKTTYDQGDLKSVKLILQLPKSSYATIAIRQLLHIPSSFKVQSQLNYLYEKV